MRATLRIEPSFRPAAEPLPGLFFMLLTRGGLLDRTVRCPVLSGMLEEAASYTGG